MTFKKVAHLGRAAGYVRDRLGGVPFGAVPVRGTRDVLVFANDLAGQPERAAAVVGASQSLFGLDLFEVGDCEYVRPGPGGRCTAACLVTPPGHLDAADALRRCHDHVWSAAFIVAVHDRTRRGARAARLRKASASVRAARPAALAALEGVVLPPLRSLTPGGKPAGLPSPPAAPGGGAGGTRRAAAARRSSASGTRAA